MFRICDGTCIGVVSISNVSKGIFIRKSVYMCIRANKLEAILQSWQWSWKCYFLLFWKKEVKIIYLLNIFSFHL